MKRQEYEHSKLQGVDADIETSLKEYGFAWIEGETDILFYYGIHTVENEYREMEFDRFDFCTFDKDIDIKKEFNWIDEDDWHEVMSYVGADFDDWNEMSLAMKIYDLNQYYGYMNVFGDGYYVGLKYEDIVSED